MVIWIQLLGFWLSVRATNAMAVVQLDGDQAIAILESGGELMPARSRAQQKWAYAELERKAKGQKTESGMTEEQLDEFAHSKTKGKPEHVKKKKHSGY